MERKDIKPFLGKKVPFTVLVLLVLLIVPMSSALTCDYGSLDTRCVVNETNQDVTGETVTGSGSFLLGSGITLTTSSGSGTTATFDMGGNITLEGTLQGNFNLSATNVSILGTIDSNGKGYAGGSSGNDGSGTGGGRGVASTGSEFDGGGAGYASRGGDGHQPSADGGSSYGDKTLPNKLGSGGGGGGGAAGGNGGGLVWIDASNYVDIPGTISSNGNSGSSSGDGSGGGGSGGSIYIEADRIDGTGTIRANGGDGPSGAGGGSGGRVSIQVTTDEFTGTIESMAGSGRNYGGTGSFYPQDFLCSSGSMADTCTLTEQIGIGYLEGSSLRLKGGSNAGLYSHGHMDLNFSDVKVEGGTIINPGQNITFTGTENLTILGSFTPGANWSADLQRLSIYSGSTVTPRYAFLNVSSFDIKSDADITADRTIKIDASQNVTIPDGARLEARRINLTAPNLTVESNAVFDTDERGYPEETGPGAGCHASANHADAGGAGYGGQGENADCTNPDQIYGNPEWPTLLGSGGGDANGRRCYASGGGGGGAIKINTSDTLTINGQITADGGNGGSNNRAYGHADAGGGSGGSIAIQTNTIQGAGQITANGGHADPGAGGGAGGRIAVHAETDEFTGNVFSRPGGTGGAGTTYPKKFYCDSGDLSSQCIIDSVHYTRKLNGTGNLKLESGGKIYSPQNFTSINFSFIDIRSGAEIKTWNNHEIVLEGVEEIYNNGLLESSGATESTTLKNISIDGTWKVHGQANLPNLVNLTSTDTTVIDSSINFSSLENLEIPSGSTTFHRQTKLPSLENLDVGGSFTVKSDLWMENLQQANIPGTLTTHGNLTVNTPQLDVSGTLNVGQNLTVDQLAYIDLPGKIQADNTLRFNDLQEADIGGNLRTDEDNSDSNIYLPVLENLTIRTNGNLRSHENLSMESLLNLTVKNGGRVRGDTDIVTGESLKEIYIDTNGRFFDNSELILPQLDKIEVHGPNDGTDNLYVNGNLSMGSLQEADIYGTINVQENISASSFNRFTVYQDALIKGDKINLTGTNLTMETGAHLSTNERGYYQGPGQGEQFEGNGGGGGFGGIGGANELGEGGDMYGSRENPVQMGSGGWDGSTPGGGAVRLDISDTAEIQGNITANGQPGHGGGSGGSIWVTADKVTGTGSLKANGGDGRDGHGGGAGGRISIQTPDDQFGGLVQTLGGGQNGGPGTIYPQKYYCDNPEGRLDTQCNISDVHHVKNLNGTGELYVNEGGKLFSGNVDLNLNFSKIHVRYQGEIGNDAYYRSPVLNLTSPHIRVNGQINFYNKMWASADTFNVSKTLDDEYNTVRGKISGGDDLVIQDVETFDNFGTVESGESINIEATDSNFYPNSLVQDLNRGSGTIKVDSGNMEVMGDAELRSRRINITSDSLEVRQGAWLNSDRRGYPGATGPGAEAVNGGGASHGGKGAPGWGEGSKNIYGNREWPTMLGSGGADGDCNADGGYGGGAIKINTTSTLTINGQITANGAQGGSDSWCGPDDNPEDGGGGSGGSIAIQTDTIQGNGQITANGGYGGTGDGANGGAGGGGRIAIHENIDQFDGHVYTKSDDRGGAGTTYPQKYYCDNSGGNLESTCEINTEHHLKELAGDTVLINNTVYSGQSNIHLNFTRIDLLSNGKVQSLNNNITFAGTERLEGSGGSIIANNFVKGEGIRNIDHQGYISTSNGNIRLSNTGQTFSLSGTVDASLNTIDLDGEEISIPSGSLNARRINITSLDLSIGETATLNVDRRGYGSGNGPGAGCYVNKPRYAESGGAGYGGQGEDENADCSNPGQIYGNPEWPTLLGSGGGDANGYRCYASGGGGGGAIKINTSDTLTINGQITADGGNGGSDHGSGWGKDGHAYAGGGSGGSIAIQTNTIKGTGKIGANGGAGAGGAGAGGRIAIHENIDQFDGHVYTKSEGRGGAGTTYPKKYYCDNSGGNLSTVCEINTDHYLRQLNGEELIVNDRIFTPIEDLSLSFTNISLCSSCKIRSYRGKATLIGNNNGKFELDGTVQGSESVTINEGGDLVTNQVMSDNSDIEMRNWEDIILNGSVDSPGTIDLGSTAAINALSNTLASSSQIFVETEDFTTDSGSAFTTDSKGYGPQSGPGAGGSNSGGGYGGKGGGSNGGLDYGTYTSPSDMGSGGEDGAGGGKITVSATNLVSIDGTLSCNGQSGGDGGGAGGSIMITAESFQGTGQLEVIGGDATYGGGAGGRIAVYRTYNSFEGNIDVQGGNADDNGESGTVFQSDTTDILDYLNITITDARGNPIVDKPVTVYRKDSNLSACSYWTDTEGKISCKILETREYDIASSLFSSDVEGRVWRGVTVPGQVTVRQSSILRVLEIGNNTAVDGATVTVETPQGNVACKGQTNSTGHVTCALQDTNYNIKIEKDGYQTLKSFIYRPDDRVFHIAKDIQTDTICGQEDDIHITSDCTVSPGKYEVDSFKVDTGTTVTMQGDGNQDSSSSFGGVRIQSHGPVVINGTLDAVGQGYSSNSGPGAGGSGEYGDGGAGYGNAGGAGGGNGTVGHSGGSSYGSETEAVRLGSGGGDGGSGGGAVWIDSRSYIDLEGQIKADGEDAGSGHGGGSGGAVRLDAPILKGQGTITSTGGNGGDDTSLYGGGGAAGGRIVFNSTTQIPDYSTDVVGGSGGDGNTSISQSSGEMGGDGTVIFNARSHNVKIELLDEQGNPISGEKIEIERSRTPYTACKGLTDQNGFFNCTVPTGQEYDIATTAWNDKYKITKVELSPPIEQTLEKNLEVKIEDSGGNPVQGIETFVHTQGSEDKKCHGETNTEGIVKCSVDTGKRYDIAIQDPGWKQKFNVSPPSQVLISNFNTLDVLAEETRSPINSFPKDVRVSVYRNGEDALKCEGATNTIGRIACSLNTDYRYDIGIKEYNTSEDERSFHPFSLVRENLGIPSVRSLDVKKYVMDIFSVGSTGETNPDQGFEVFGQDTGGKACEGQTNDQGKMVCTLDDDKEYKIKSQDGLLERALVPVPEDTTIQYTPSQDLINVTFVDEKGRRLEGVPFSVTLDSNSNDVCAGTTSTLGKLVCGLTGDTYNLNLGDDSNPVLSDISIGNSYKVKRHFDHYLNTTKVEKGETIRTTGQLWYGKSPTNGRALSKEQLEFYIDGEMIGTTVTDTDGSFEFMFTPEEAGTHTLKINLTDKYGKYNERKVTFGVIDLANDIDIINVTLKDGGLPIYEPVTLSGITDITGYPDKNGHLGFAVNDKDFYSLYSRVRNVTGVQPPTVVSLTPYASVTVEDLSGEPVAGKEVYVTPEGSSGEENVLCYQQTDTDGEAFCKLNSSREYDIRLSTSVSTPVAKGMPPIEIVTAPSGARGSIKFEMYSKDGTRVSHEEIKAYSTSGRQVFRTQSTDNGMFYAKPPSFDAPYDLQTSAWTGEPTRVRMNVPTNFDSPKELRPNFRTNLVDLNGAGLGGITTDVYSADTGNKVCTGDSNSSGKIICSLPEGQEYNIRTVGGVERYGVSSPEQTIVQVGAESNNRMLNITLKGPNNESLNDTEVSIYSSDSGAISCRGDTNQDGEMSCGLDRNYKYDIYSEGQILLANVEVPDDLVLGRNMEMKVVNSTGQPVTGQEINVTNTFSGDLSCSGETNEEGVIRCGLEKGAKYDIWSEYGLERYRAKMPETGTIQVSPNNKMLNLTIRNRTESRKPEVDLAITDKSGQTMCSGSTNDLGDIRCGLDPSKTYELHTSLYSGSTQAVRADLQAPESMNIIPNTNVSLYNYTGEPAEAGIRLIDNKTGMGGCYGQLTSGKITCALNSSRTYQIAPYYRRTQEGNASVITPPGEKILETLAIKTYNPENRDVLDPSNSRTDKEAWIEEGNKTLCRGYTGSPGEEPLYCGLEPDSLYSVNNPIFNVTGIETNKTIKIGWGTSDTSVVAPTSYNNYGVVGRNFSYPVEVENTGDEYIYNITANVTVPAENWTGYSSFKGGIPPGEKENITVDVFVPEGSADDVQSLEANVSWTNPDLTNGSNTDSGSIFVVATGRVSSNSSIEATIGEGEGYKRAGSMIINSVGNANAEAEYSLAGLSWGDGYDPIPPLEIPLGDSANVTSYISVPENTLQGTYNGKIELYDISTEKRKDDEVNITIHVPPSIEYSRTPADLGTTTTPIGEEGYIGEIVISNNGNKNLTFSVNKETEVLGTSDFIYMNQDDRGFDLEPGKDRRIDVNYTIDTDETGGLYDFNITLECSPGCPTRRTHTQLEVLDVPPEITDYSYAPKYLEPGQQINWSANVTDNKAVNKTWVDIQDGPNITAEKVGVVNATYKADYTPPEEEAEYQFKIYARDNAEPDPLVTSTDTETFYVVPDTQISTGFNQSVFNMDEISASQGSSFNVETVFANTGTGDRGQTAENVNYEVNLPNSTWNAEPSSKELGSIEYGENKSENIKITIPAGTSPGTYRPQVITEWKNADGNINTTERRFKVVVEENPELSVSADLKTVSMENNDTSEFSTTITSSGNTRVESISVDCEEGEACEDLYISSETPVSLAPGEESQLNVTIEAPAGVPDKIYEGELVVAGLKAKDNMSLNVDIAKELDFKSKPSETNISAGPGAELILDSIVLQNTGNQPLEVSAPYSENIVFDPSDMSLGVNDEESMDVRLYAPEDPGNYAYNLTIDLYDHQTFEKLTAPYNVSLEVYDYTISLQDISKEKEIVPGDETTMEVEAQFEGTEITSNVNWDAYIGERKADIVGSSYNTDKGVWEVTVEAPELQQGRKYTLHLEGEWQEKNVRNNVEKEDRIWYKDTEGPVFSYLDAEDVKNTDSTIRTEITDPGEVANVSTVNATVYQPSGGELEPEMTRDDDLWKGEVTSGFLSETGYYDVEVSAGDTAGNVNSNSTFIQVYEDLPVSGEIYAPDGTGVPTTLKLFRPNTSAEIHEINAEQGNYSKTIRTGTYDLLIEANNTAHIQLYNVTGEDLKGNMINIDPNIPNAYVDLPNSSNENELYGVSVNTSEFKNAQGTIALDYRDYEYQLENVRYLSLYKCENWGFDDQEKGCQSSWEKETTAIVPDEKLAITDLDGFSAYYLAEKGGYDDPNATEPPADENETTDNETSTDDGTSGGSGGTIVNPGSGDDGGLEEDEFQSGIDQLLDALKDNRSESLVDFTNQRIDATLKPAQERNTAVNIKNNVNVSQMLETALSSSLQKYVYVKDSLNLSAGETEELPVVISIPGDAEPNTYSGYLTITGSAVEKEIPINIEIVPREKKLLDLVIEPVFSSITPGTNLRVQASLSNQGYSRNVDVDLNLEMFDPERNMTVAKTSTTVAVATTVDKVLEIEIPEDLMLKTYELRATASYSNKEAQSVARSIKNIDVRKPFWEQRIQGIQHRTLALAIVVLLISGLSSYAYYQRWKQKMLKKKRYTENIDLDTIPSGGERQAFVGELAEMGTKTYAKLDDLTTHTLIAGATGSGKTVTGQVMVEEALKKGATVIVLDPTAQWSGYLRECNDKGMLQHYDRFGMSKDEAQAFDGNIRAIEPGEEIDITPYLDNENSQGEIIVFSMHKLDSKNLDEFVNNTIQQVFDANLPERNELDTVIVYDEVHRLLDKFGGSGKGLKQLERGAREFRKWGVGMILLSQVISDFSGEIRANIGTTIQMRTQYENDLERMKDKFNMDTVKSIVKAEVGSGMLQNSEYNHGRPYFVDFRPLLHSPHRLTDEELEKYEEYNRKIDSVEEKIQELEDQGEEVYEFRSELKLAKRNLRKGSFNLVDIYLDELKENVEEKL